MSGDQPAPALVVLNFIPLVGGGIIARFDLQVTRWRVIFRRCWWRQRADGDRIELSCRAVDFVNPHDERVFQEMALAAVRAAASLHVQQVKEVKARKSPKIAQVTPSI